MVRIKYATSSDSFIGNCRHQAAAQLRIIAERIENGECAGNVQDTNGNTIGKWEATKMGN